VIVQRISTTDIKKNCTRNFAAYFLLPVVPLFLFFTKIYAQICPPNIDFETGTFNNWKCYVGSTSAVNDENVISLSQTTGPIPDRHTMYDALLQPNEVDYYGGFPVNCPNGSGHSVRLGNDRGGGEAEGISYEFTIPDNQNTYSLIYHYAVVFQDPNHLEFQQPRLVIEAANATDNEPIYCSSFTFIPYGSLLPGFFISPIIRDTTNVWCKDWSAVSINLNGNAGKTIRLTFKTADCTFTRHFGYAYIDVNSECSSEFAGAAYCPDDTAVRITAPYGYQGYTWFNNNFTQTIGTEQSIVFKPPPPAGSKVAVEVVPYDGYGCRDTLYALLIDTLTVTANAGKDTLSCNQNPVPIGVTPRPGLVYKWSPAAGLSDPNIANPRAGPNIKTTYTLTTSSFGGGCATTDEIVVDASIIDTNLTLLGKAAYCLGTGDSAVLLVQPTKSIQWLKDNAGIGGATGIKYRVRQSGIYRAFLTNEKGCSISSAKKQIIVETPRPAIRYPDQSAVTDYPLQLQARDFGINTVWNPATYLDNPLSVTPIFYGPLEKSYTITIKTAGGCTTVDTQLVKVFKEIKFYVPGAFTPNNDGLNDFLKPIAAGITEIRYFRIYNRWGQLIFDLRSNSLGWDGKINGTPQASQVVVWIAEGIGANKSTYSQKGTCVLIR
jgi:gliding motility-associated-like protein